jgi:hypothetical protein
MKKPWIAITWFAVWGLFQAFAVASVLNGTWDRPESFPEEAYNALVYPDVVFIPLYLVAAMLLFRGHWVGLVLGLSCCGAVTYAMVYLLALANFQGPINLTFDFLFLTMTAMSLAQLSARLRRRVARSVTG